MPQHSDRHVPLQGATNFRDLGGYPGHGSRPLRWRKLFRSDHLAGLTDADHAVLAGLDDPEAVYLARFLPAKARMQAAALAQQSFTGDLHILARTLALLWSPAARLASARAMRELL